MVQSGLTQDVLLGLYSDKERYITVAFSYLHDREKAKDVFSDTYTYIYERKDSLVGDLQMMKGYFMQTLRHRCLNELKRDSVRQQTFKNIYEEDIKVLGDDNVSRKILLKDIRTILDNAGLRLPKLTFDIFVSSRIGGLSHKEISLLYGISEGKVAKEIMKAGKVINTVMSKYFQILLVFAFLFQ